jgi:rhodanese-related sulfurtransferase
MSPKSAGLAKKWGYTNVSVYIEGEPAWKKVGFITTSTPEYIRKGNIVLVDLRSSDDVMKGHIPGAVNIPAMELTVARSMFPSFMGAHIIYYSDSSGTVKKAIKISNGWGYKKATALLDGIDAWQRAGYKLSTGPALKKIDYVRKLSPGEISIADFKKAISSDTVILDVRTPEEFSYGHFPNAINIPVDNLSSRYTEIDKNRSILTQCKTGVRAEMAYTILKEKGYNVKYLKARCEFRADGVYSIQE